jgi:hypothetical protein
MARRAENRGDEALGKVLDDDDRGPPRRAGQEEESGCGAAANADAQRWGFATRVFHLLNKIAHSRTLDPARGASIRLGGRKASNGRGGLWRGVRRKEATGDDCR